MSWTFYTAREVSIIRLRRSQGATMAAIAKELGRSKTSVEHRARLSGIPHRPVRLSDEQIAMALDMHARGCTKKAIAEKLGVQHETVSRIPGIPYKPRPRKG